MAQRWLDAADPIDAHLPAAPAAIRTDERFQHMRDQGCGFHRPLAAAAPGRILVVVFRERLWQRDRQPSHTGLRQRAKGKDRSAIHRNATIAVIDAPLAAYDSSAHPLRGMQEIDKIVDPVNY